MSETDDVSAEDPAREPGEGAAEQAERERRELGEEDTFRVIHRRVPARQRSDDYAVVGGSVLTGLGAIAFAVTVIMDTEPEWQLLALAVAIVSFLSAFRRYFAAVYPQVEAVEPRHELAEERAPVSDIIPISRRRLLVRALTGSGVLLGLGALIPVSSLGPRFRAPETGWRDGIRLVNEQGRAMRADDVPVGGVAVVWPQGSMRVEHGSVMLVRLTAQPEEPTRMEWVVDGTLIAYSKVCTHAGCPVGIFREATNTLYCPCHQAQFDAARGASVVFGPAGRPLPQLPLAVDGDGFLIATGDFQEPVGPPQG